ncbi:hypothetical protein B0H17DRAFT_993249, partial [Mycena rosella]
GPDLVPTRPRPNRSGFLAFLALGPFAVARLRAPVNTNTKGARDPSGCTRWRRTLPKIVALVATGRCLGLAVIHR